MTRERLKQLEGATVGERATSFAGLTAAKLGSDAWVHRPVPDIFKQHKVTRSAGWFSQLIGATKVSTWSVLVSMKLAEPVDDDAQLILQAFLQGKAPGQPGRTNIAPVTDFAARSARMHAAGLVDTAIDLVHDSVDEFFQCGRFALLDSVLLDVDPSGIPSDVLLALIITTRPAKHKLATRAAFLKRAIEALEARPDFDPRAIKNLRD